jgi:TldD protein
MSRPISAAPHMQSDTLANLTTRKFIPKSDFKKLAGIALDAAKKHGASYADIRICRYNNEVIFTREERMEFINNSENFGFGIRVLLDGTWGFASSSLITEARILQMTERAVQIAKANALIQNRKVELETIPAYTDTYVMPMKRDPFSVLTDEKVNLLLRINAEAQKSGADFCSSYLMFVKEEKYFASSVGSFIDQTRVRSYPSFTVTSVDKSTGKFETRTSLAAPRGEAYEYIEHYDFIGEVQQATEESKMKHKALSVSEGKKDLILHPSHLWLTIHESVGHATELDRALGYEANYAGTSFATPDKLHHLKYGSEYITILGDRTEENGLATIKYDDDGVKTVSFPIVEKGEFVGYQTAMGQAKQIGQTQSNGCSFADSWDKFPIQRMPNVSLQPSDKNISMTDLIGGVDDGVLIMGDGSWSIDQQRYNFQFGGQVYYEIKHGKVGQMLRDVAYQSNTTDFWNACDGVAGKSEYFLGGSFYCGKGQPGQIAPVSHGSVPARFRGINILNTARKDI